MTDIKWRADENGAALHMPDPTGLTNGVTVVLESGEIERIYQTIRAAQLGADGEGSL